MSMKRLDLLIGGEAIPFYLGDNCVEEVCAKLCGLEADRYIIVTDDRVKDMYGVNLAAVLNRNRPTTILSAPSGEEGKNLKSLVSYAERAIQWGATRRTVVVTLGGGVPGNLGGLLAALLFRGIRLVHMPTTLIGMLDSVISFKQSVNSSFGKNLIGTFYRPLMILADTQTLKTLPAREIRAGVCEVIKNAVAIHPHIIERLLDILNPDCKYRSADFRFLLETSLAAKMEVMVADPCERGRGLILEYGHTIGHAIELADSCGNGGQRISHGEAVGIGMLGAAQIANLLTGLEDSAVAVHHELLLRAGACRNLPVRIHPEEVMRVLMFDNKRGYRQPRAGNIDMILLYKLGIPSGELDMPLTSVPLSNVRDVIESLGG